MRSFLCLVAAVIPMCQFHHEPQDPLRITWKRYGLPRGALWPALLALCLASCDSLTPPDPAKEAVIAPFAADVLKEIYNTPTE